MKIQHNEMSKELSSKEHKRPLVYPCCCGAKHDKFFFVFTILLMIEQSLSFLSELKGFLSYRSSGLFVSCLLSGLLLAWIIKVFVDFMKQGLYGTGWAYGLGLTYFIFSCINSGIILLILIILIAFTSVFNSMVFDVNHIGIAFGIILAIIVLIFLLSLYIIYLCFLYFSVIKNEKNKTEKTEKDVDSAIEQTQNRSQNFA